MKKVVEKTKLYIVEWHKDHRNRKFYVIKFTFVNNLSLEIRERVLQFMRMHCVHMNKHQYYWNSSWKLKTNDLNEVHELCTMISMIAA